MLWFTDLTTPDPYYGLPIMCAAATAGMVRFGSPMKTGLHKTILANSISLTPGTLTVLVEEEEFMVHALTRKNAEEVVTWELAEELAKIEAADENASADAPF